jgi:lambda family phage tail tape measure protein
MSVKNAAYFLEVSDAYYAEEEAAAEKMAEYEILTGQRVAHDQIRQLDDLLLDYKSKFVPGVKSALQEIEDDYSNTGKQMGDFTKRTFDSMADTLADNTMKMKFDFTDLTNSVIKDLLRIYYKQQILGPLSTASQSWLGSLFGDQSNWKSIEGMTAEGVAHGDVFNNYRLSKYAKGHVAYTPEIFTMANGIGLRGEAGAEGILPLGRTASGDLGVKTIGSGTPQAVTVQIINESGQAVKATKSSATFDMQRMIVSVWIDALDRNVGGLGDRLGR